MLRLNQIKVDVSEDEKEMMTTVRTSVLIHVDVKVDTMALTNANGFKNDAIYHAAMEGRAKIMAYLYGDLRRVIADLLFQLRREAPSALNNTGGEELRKIENALNELGIL